MYMPQKKSQNPPKLEVPHKSCFRSQNILQDIQKRVIFSPKRSSVHYNQPTNPKVSTFPRVCNPILHVLYILLTELMFQVKSAGIKDSKFRVIF